MINAHYLKKKKKNFFIIIPVPLKLDGDNHKFEQTMFVLILAEEICFVFLPLSLSLSSLFV